MWFVNVNVSSYYCLLDLWPNLMLFAWKHWAGLSLSVAWFRGFQGKLQKRSLYPWVIGKSNHIFRLLGQSVPSSTLQSMKSFFSGVPCCSLCSILFSPPLGNIFLLPPSLLYLFSWTQNLSPEKNTNKLIVLVTLAFWNLKVLTQNVWLTYLEVLIRFGWLGDWTVSWNTQVLSISLFC